MFVIKEMVSDELPSKLDQLIYREANDRNGGLRTLLRGDGMLCLAPSAKTKQQTVEFTSESFCSHCLKSPEGMPCTKRSFGARQHYLKQRTHGCMS